MVKKALKTLVFLLILTGLILGVQSALKIRDYRAYTTMTEFYREPENDLDAVYVGASNVYAFWQAPLAFGEYGMTVYPLSIPSMPASALRYMIEEARKTQPDALYIVNLNAFKETDITPTSLHYLVDFTRFSSTKVRMIRDLAPRCVEGAFAKLEFYFPLIRFHSRWSELTTADFYHPEDGMKAGVKYELFLNTVPENELVHRETDQRISMTGEQEDILEDLLDYCDETNLRCLFVIVPQSIADESVLAQLLSIGDAISGRGYDVLHLENAQEDMGLDLTEDYYNAKHTNVHGSLKFTEYFGRYLSEHYGFADKRGDPAYAAWDLAAERYEEAISPYTLDFERSHLPREDALAAPALTGLTPTGQSFELTWEAVAEADSYRVYRKHLDPDTLAYSPWEAVASVSGKTAVEGVLAYTDQNLLTDVEYTYTVVPVSKADDGGLFGHYDSQGIVGTTILDPPKLVSLETAEDGGITLTWEPVPGADGYTVKRKLNGQSWVTIEDVGEETSYTDYYYQEGLPYLYSAAAYKTGEETTANGYFDHTGLLYRQDLASPTLSAGLRKDQTCVLTWDSIKGADNYFVYRSVNGGEWEFLAQKHRLSTHVYRDPALENGVSYSYMVTAAIKYGEERFEYPSNVVTIRGGER